MPAARIAHRSSRRLRLRVASRRGREDYFAAVAAGLTGWRRWDRLEVNPLTGSVLLCSRSIDLEKIEFHARRLGLFYLDSNARMPRPMMHAVVHPITGLDRTLRGMTGGILDLPSGVFFALLGSGIYQLARNPISAPPWYTAFWYAFGLLTMYAVSGSQASGQPRLEA